MDILDRLLDRFLNPHIVVFDWRVPSWWFFGTLGTATGAVIFVYQDTPPFTLSLTVVLLNVLSFLLLRSVYRRADGATRSVLLEHLLLAFAVTVTVLAAFGILSLVTLDRWAIAMTVIIALGRVGCLSTGCCYGRAWAHGARYPWHLWNDAPAQLAAVRLYPVQLVEALLLSALFAAECAAARWRSPGSALLLLACGYASIRFWTEFYRGDDRSYWGSLSQAQWLALGLVAASALVATRRMDIGWLVMAAASALVVSLGWVLHPAMRGRPAVPPLRRGVIMELTETLVRLFQQTRTAGTLSLVTSRGVQLTGERTSDGYQLHIGPLDAGSTALVGYLARVVCGDDGVEWPLRIDGADRTVTIRSCPAVARTP